MKLKHVCSVAFSAQEVVDELECGTLKVTADTIQQGRDRDNEGHVRRYESQEAPRPDSRPQQLLARFSAGNVGGVDVDSVRGSAGVLYGFECGL